MPRPTRLQTAPDELALVRRALDAGFCCQASLAAELGVGRPTLTNWLTGKRPPPAGLVFGLLRHLDGAERRQVLRWLVEAEAPESDSTVVDLAAHRRQQAQRQAADELAAAATRFLTLHKQAA